MTSTPQAAGMSQGSDHDREPGVSRYHLICSPCVREATEELMCRWGQDRALPQAGVGRLSLLTSTAVTHGLLFRPRAVTVSVRWADLDRVRVELRWHGVAGPTPGTVTQSELESTIAIFDAIADEWGFGHGAKPTHWLVLDTAV